MKNITISTSSALKSIPRELINAVEEEVQRGYSTLINGTGLGNDFLGWMRLPMSFTNEQLSVIMNDATRIKRISDVVVVIGIGGSYLGTRAVIEAVSADKRFSKKPTILYAGHNLNPVYLNNLIAQLDKVDYSIVVISKSGTTTEPAIAFRILREHLQNKYGKTEAANRIIAITDAKRGTLRKLSIDNGYTTYSIPDDVGGRFSVLSPVGLVPLAIAGIDIQSLLKGAASMAEICLDKESFFNSSAYNYVLTRNVLYAAGYDIELMVNYLDHLNYLSEWWKQLYGESEGKDGKGIFPASVSFTTDLHSLGQFIQGGTKKLFETVIQVQTTRKDVIIPKLDDDVDNLNYIAGKSVNSVNKIAQKATTMAHVSGKVPNISIKVPQITEESIGQLIYLFEFACGVSGYTINVNPFDQPDVEAYKKNMFKLLGKE